MVPNKWLSWYRLMIKIIIHRHGHSAIPWRLRSAGWRKHQHHPGDPQLHWAKSHKTIRARRGSGRRHIPKQYQFRWVLCWFLVKLGWGKINSAEFLLSEFLLSAYAITVTLAAPFYFTISSHQLFWTEPHFFLQLGCFLSGCNYFSYSQICSQYFGCYT